ncbi:programmed cell death protein 7 [Pholidichthys leucotaenia]
MDARYHPDSSLPPVSNADNFQTGYSSSGFHEPMKPVDTAPPWGSSPVYGAAPPYVPGFDFPSGGAGFGGPGFVPQYRFDPSVPPPPFVPPPSGPFPCMPPPAPVNTRTGFPPPSQPFRAAHQPPYDREQSRYEEIHEWGGDLLGGPGKDRDRDTGASPQPEEDEAVRQKKQDSQWVRRFLQDRKTSSRSPQREQRRRSPLSSIPAIREALYLAAQLICRLEETCSALKQNLHDGSVWTEAYSAALRVQRELQHKVSLLSDPGLKVQVDRAARRRTRRLRARREQQLEEEEAEERRAEKEARIDKWRMRQKQQVEEKKKEQELKLAADSVLCEVRKKQADVKRVQDILRSLEKLRRLRAEAVSKKGIVTEQQSTEVFCSRLERLRRVTRKRTVVYAAEEKALMVMLEGEQEEERRRERERQATKEREKRLQRKISMDAMLFGEELPVNQFLQPFREYYSQAEHCLQTLIQIRRDWDVFLVAADHPEGSSVPESWILPAPPSDGAWASALQTAECDC